MKKGFTLIELLVVIAIIGILATIIIINVASARTKATRSSISSNLGTAVRTYAACQSFGTTGTTKAPVSGVTGTATCTAAGLTSITDTSEKSAATGSWPNLPTGYSYTTLVAATDLAQVQFDATTTMTVTCTISGCTTSATW